MLLTIDAGNTNTVFAVFDEDRIAGQWRIATDRDRTSDEYALAITQFLAMGGIEPDSIKVVVVANVVPQAMFQIRSMCRKYFNCEPIVVGEENVKLGDRKSVV